MQKLSGMLCSVYLVLQARCLRDSLKDKESLEYKDLQRKFFVLVKLFKCFLKENYSSSESEEIFRSALIDLIMFFTFSIYLHYFKNTCR